MHSRRRGYAWTVPWVALRERVTETQGAFRSHRTWPRAFAEAAGFDRVGSVSAGLVALREGVVAAQAFQRLAERQSPAIGQIRTSLAHAWGTELLLSLSGRHTSEDALKRLTVNWGVVQLYRALYHATQAVFVADTGQDRPEDHSATRRIFTDRWCTRVRAPAFLALAFGPGGPANAPAGVELNERIHPWSACDDRTCWSHALLALRTTRRDDVVDSIARQRTEKQKTLRKDWLERERARNTRGREARPEPEFRLPLLTLAEKQQVNQRIRPYSLIDYVYRLRIKTNYADSAVFTEGPAPGEASAVHADLVRLAAASLLAHELHVRRLIGVERMRVLADSWLKGNMPPGQRVGLALRRDLVLC